MARIFFPGAPVQIAQAPAGGASAPAAPGAPRRAAARRRHQRQGQGRVRQRRRAEVSLQIRTNKPEHAHVLPLLHRPADLRGGAVDLHRASPASRRCASLPIAQYPEIAPPVVTVRAVYPGASAEVLEQTVAAPLENAINGVEHMLYMSSTSTSERRRADPGHLRDRHRRRPGRAERQQPRQAGRGQAAAGSAAPGRHGRERLLGVPAGAGVLLARRQLRRPVHVRTT